MQGLRVPLITPMVIADIILLVIAVWMGWEVFAYFWAGTLFGIQVTRLAIRREIKNFLVPEEKKEGEQ